MFLLPASLLLFGVSLLAPLGVLRLGVGMYAVLRLSAAAHPVVRARGQGRHALAADLRFAAAAERVRQAGGGGPDAASMLSRRPGRPAAAGGTLPLVLPVLAVLVAAARRRHDRAWSRMVFGVQLFVAGLGWFWVLLLLGAGVVGALAGLSLAAALRRARERLPRSRARSATRSSGPCAPSPAAACSAAGPGEGVQKWHLPDAHADFIFAATAEEFGIVACLALVALFAFLILRGLVARERDQRPLRPARGHGPDRRVRPAGADQHGGQPQPDPDQGHDAAVHQLWRLLAAGAGHRHGHAAGADPARRPAAAAGHAWSGARDRPDPDRRRRHRRPHVPGPGARARLAPAGAATVALLTDSRGARYVGGELPYTVVSAGSPSGGLGARLRGHRRSWPAAWSRACWRCAASGRSAAAAFGGYASVPARWPRPPEPRAAPGPRAERRVRPRQPADGPLRADRGAQLRAAPPRCLPEPGLRRLLTGNPTRPEFAHGAAAAGSVRPLPPPRAGRQPGRAGLQRRGAGGPRPCCRPSCARDWISPSSAGRRIWTASAPPMPAIGLEAELASFFADVPGAHGARPTCWSAAPAPRPWPSCWRWAGRRCWCPTCTPPTTTRPPTRRPWPMPAPRFWCRSRS